MPEYHLIAAASHHTLGDVVEQMGRHLDAERSYRRAIALEEKLAGNWPAMPEYQRKLAISNVKLAALLQAAGRPAEAEQEYRRAIALAEKVADPEAWNELCWGLATSPSPGLRDPQLALRLAKKAVEQTPQNGSYWNTLGVAHYRAGEWKAAIEALEKSMQLRAGGDSAVWFFLAMARWQRGENDQARQWFDKAVNRIDSNKSQYEDLRRFRAEAAALLGVTEHPKSTAKKEEDTPRRSKP